MVILVLPATNFPMLLSEETVVPARLPATTGSIITTAGLLTTFFIGKTLDSRNIKIGAGLALAGGAIAYKYLSYFTPESKLDKAKEILEKNDAKIKKDNIIFGKNSASGAILREISNKYLAEDYPEITFLKDDFKKLSTTTTHAEELIKITSNSLRVEYSEEKPLLQKIKNTIIDWLKYVDPTLEKQLETEEKKATEIVEILFKVSSAIKDHKDFDDHLTKYNQQKNNETTALLQNEKTIYLKNKNSYLSGVITALCANNTFMESLGNIIMYLIYVIRGEGAKSE